MGSPLGGIAEYMLVQERFALAEQAYAAVKAAHRRGDYSGTERDHLHRAVNGVREAARAFRQVRALEGDPQRTPDGPHGKPVRRHRQG